MSVTIGSRIKEVRKSLKMKQNELAEAIGVHFTMISLYESGKREPSRETVEGIARVTNVSADYIMGLSDHKTLSVESSKQVTNKVDDLMMRMKEIEESDPEKYKRILDLINN